MAVFRGGWAAVGLVLGLLTWVADAYGAPSFANPAPIAIVDNANSSLYPSTINVPNSTPITSVTVALIGLQHERLSDLTVLLVSPSGKKIQLMANAPGSMSTPNDLRLAQEGQGFPGGEINPEHTYRPTVIPGPIAMAAPAPGLPYETSFASLIGDNAQGVWSLYVRDNVSGTSGVIGGGWAIAFAGGGGSFLSSEFDYQGVLRNAGGPLNGLFDIRLRFYNSPISSGNHHGEATALGVPVQNGVFSARFTPADTIFSEGLQVFVEIAVKGAGDPDFVVISPRQMITAAPHAWYAAESRHSQLSDLATAVVSVKWGTITEVPSNVLNAFSPWAIQAGGAISNTNAGNVLIGTTSGTSKLTVAGTIESTTGGIKFPDDSVQTTAATASVIGGKSVSTTIGAMAPGAEITVGITFSGTSFATTDVAIVSPGSNLPADVGIQYARVASAFQVSFVLRNHGTVAANIPSMTYTVKVIR